MVEKKVDIIKDADGKSIVVINDLLMHRNIMSMQNSAGIGMIHVLQYLFMMTVWN